MSRVLEHIENKKMWLNTDGKWCKRCPSCEREIVGKDGSVTTKFNMSHSIIKKQGCHSCVKKGKPTWASLHKGEFGKNRSGSNHPMFGKHHSEIFKEWQRKRVTGTKLSSETKRKLRVLAIEQHRKNGISFPAVDSGAKEYFDNMNSYNGFHIIHPNFELKDLGYFVDGYDSVLHAVFEYDTKSHTSGRYKKRDLNRQTEIIEHFRSIGRPLNHFFRVNRTGLGAQGMIDVLNVNLEDK